MKTTYLLAFLFLFLHGQLSVGNQLLPKGSHLPDVLKLSMEHRSIGESSKFLVPKVNKFGHAGVGGGKGGGGGVGGQAVGSGSQSTHQPQSQKNKSSSSRPFASFTCFIVSLPLLMHFF